MKKILSIISICIIFIWLLFSVYNKTFNPMKYNDLPIEGGVIPGVFCFFVVCTLFTCFICMMVEIFKLLQTIIDQYETK